MTDGQVFLLLVATAWAAGALVWRLTYKHYERRLRRDDLVIDDLSEKLAKWRVDAESLGHDPTYRAMLATVEMIEDKLGIVPSKRLTVLERWKKFDGRIDARMLKILLRPDTPRPPAAAHIAARMLALERMSHHADNEHERVNAKRQLDRLLAKYP